MGVTRRGIFSEGFLSDVHVFSEHQDCYTAKHLQQVLISTLPKLYNITPEIISHQFPSIATLFTCRIFPLPPFCSYNHFSKRLSVNCCVFLYRAVVSGS